MSGDPISCLMVDEPAAEGTHSLRVASVRREELPPGDVTIAVDFSSLNYKDALAAAGHPGVVKSLPHVPGIDAAGTVLESSSPQFRTGDAVLVTGFDLGQGTWGGWSTTIRVPAAWVVPMPGGLTPKQTMTLGTAGFTAAQCALALQRNLVEPDQGEIVVTGATGGVGSIAVGLLSSLGYTVVAITGKAEQHAWLKKLGAARVAGRDELTDESGRPMLKARYAGAVDTVGGDMLNCLLRSTHYGGCVTACGLVAGAELSMTVYPFLLRGVSLCGIASADCPYERRAAIWSLLARQWPDFGHALATTDVPLAGVGAYVEKILGGNIAGRIVVNPNG